MALTDTTPEAAAVLARIYQTMPPGKRWLLLGRAYQSMRMLHATGVRLRFPSATATDIVADWVGRVLNCPHVPIMEGCAVEDLPMSITEARVVIRILQRMNIPYALGGSMASSVHGVPRSTQDGDLMVPPFLDRLPDFVAAFASGFYVSASAIQEAHRHSSSFNIITSHTGFKTDIFIASPGSFAAHALSRCRPTPLADKPEELLEVVSAEDILLLKLHWYRLGDEISDRQWGDVLGILRTQGDGIDGAYLEQWAGSLGVADLLQRALQESAL